MSALILLSNYDKMKKNKNSAPYKESDIPVDMKTMRAFRAEMLSRISSTDAKIDSLEAKVDGLAAEMKAMNVALNAKIDSAVAKMEAMFHKAMMVFEEQNLRNKQAYDSAAVSYEAVQDLKRRIKPECLEN